MHYDLLAEKIHCKRTVIWYYCVVHASVAVQPVGIWIKMHSNRLEFWRREGEFDVFIWLFSFLFVYYTTSIWLLQTGNLSDRRSYKYEGDSKQQNIIYHRPLQITVCQARTPTLCSFPINKVFASTVSACLLFTSITIIWFGIGVGRRSNVRIFANERNGISIDLDRWCGSSHTAHAQTSSSVSVHKLTIVLYYQCRWMLIAFNSIISSPHGKFVLIIN